MSARIIRSAALGLAAAMALGSLSLAQDAASPKPKDDPVEKRFKAIERQVHQLQSILTQARDTGQAISVRVTTDPDPVLEGLQSQVDDLEQAARTRNDQIDTLTHDLDLARKDAADARAEVKSLQERVAKLEARIKAIDETEAATASAADQGAPGAGPGPAAGLAPPPADDPAAAFKAAKQQLLDGEYARASAAFQDFVDRYGDTPNGPEARYWLGETLYIRGVYADAATAYIGAIRGWPQTGWAPDAVVKLARSLIYLNKQPAACQTLDEFDRRYPAASPPMKAKAQAARAAAKCGAAA